MKGPIARFLTDDHVRLAKLLQQARADIEPAAYTKFRAGLLRHIAMEEKILLPFARERRQGNPLPIAAKLRVDHGALAALLVPTPTPAIMKTIQRILEGHNSVEEGENGLYDTCDQLAGEEAEAVAGRLRAARDVRTVPNVDGPHVMDAAKRAVEKAGYKLEE